MSNSEPVKETTARRSRFGRAVLWLCTGIAIVGLALAALVFTLEGREIAAPDWVRARIEAQIVKNAPEYRVRSRDMRLSIHAGWRPEVVLRDVEIKTDAGDPVLELASLDVAFSRQGLLQRQLVPRSIYLSGIFATLRRGAQGAYDLEASAVSSEPRQADTAPDLLAQLDELFDRPELADLERIDADAITFRFEDGQSRRAWTIDGASISVARNGRMLRVASDLAILSGGASAATLRVNYSSALGEKSGSFGVELSDLPAQDLADFSPAFGWMGGLQAGLSGSLRGGFGDDGTLEPLNAALQIGAGALQPNAETRPIPFEKASVYLTFDPAQNALNFDALSIKSTWISGTADGQATLRGLESGKLTELVGQIRFSDLVAAPPDLYPAPLRLEGGEVDFRLRPDPFVVDLGRAQVLDSGTSFLLDGRLEAAEDGWKLAVNGHIDAIKDTRLLELWPPDVAAKTRGWLVRNILSADLKNAELALRSLPGSKPDIYLGFDFEDADVSFLKAFPPVTNGSGTAALLRHRFSLTIREGVVDAPQGGMMDVAGTSFVVPDVRAKPGTPGEVHLKTKGGLEAAMALLALPPTRVSDRANLPIDVASGAAAVTGFIGFPMQKGAPASSVLYDADAVLTGVSSTKLVEGRTITSDRLDVRATNTGVKISGDGRFDTLAARVAWQQALGAEQSGASSLTAEVVLSQEAMTAMNIGLPDGTVTGAGIGQLVLDFERGAVPRFKLTSDLAGVGLRIPELGWSLARDARGTLIVEGELGAVPRVDRLALDAPGLNATGRVTLNEGGGLNRAEFSRVQVGTWLDAPVTLVGRGQGVAPTVQVKGGVLDMRNLSLGTGGGGGASAGGSPIEVTLDRLQITDTIALTSMIGKFNTSGGLQGAFEGKVNGSASVTGQVEPRNGRSAFRIRSPNAGAVFSAAGILKQARNGQMSLTLLPVGDAGAFDGQLAVTDTRIKDAPAIAALINALSVVGLLEQLDGQGLHFKEVEAQFRLTKDSVFLNEASATGPSIGMSMDGTYDLNTKTMKMQGVFSPFYILNGIGSVLTRKGEGVFGFNFTLDGPADAPKVQVNPLSALTPSFLREIFRRPSPNVPTEPGETQNAPPVAREKENVDLLRP
ncbi:MAG: AsmA-like C-terminal domain-containing protein [Pseudomonadota bacterium]